MRLNENWAQTNASGIRTVAVNGGATRLKRVGIGNERVKKIGGKWTGD